MLKKTVALPNIDRQFEKRVAKLAGDGRELIASYQDLCVRMLKFAADFKSLWDQSKELDKSTNGVHSLYLRDQLAEIAQSQSATVWSKWNTIGAQAENLLEFKDTIPPQRECLYELAIAATEKKPIQKWIDEEKLTSNSTVREVISLRKPAKRKPRVREYLATVSLSFEDYDTAAETLKELIRSDSDFKISAHRAFTSAIKSKLEAEDYEKAKERFG